MKSLEKKQTNFSAMQQHASCGWSDVRDPSSYHFRYDHYSFGLRKVAIHDDRCELLQASRSLNFQLSDNYESFLEEFNRTFGTINIYDDFRYRELKSLESSDLLSLDRTMTFYEYGFRSASLFNLWKKEKFSSIKGCDIVQACVDVTRDLGFNTERINLNLEVPDLSTVSLLCAYHVLEHLTEPMACIKKSYDALPKGAVFHAEIPIEPDGPRLRYGHLFPFHSHDLEQMFKECGFEIIHFSDSPLPGGPAIERIVAVKR